MKPDLRNVKSLTPAEIRSLRFQRETNRKPEIEKKKRKNKIGARQPHRTVVIASVSIRPELKVRAERDIGRGNFSKAVTRALTHVLYLMDKGQPDEKDTTNPLLDLPQLLR